MMRLAALVALIVATSAQAQQVEVPKQNSYGAVSGADARVPKQNAYGAMSGADVRLTKQNAYAVIISALTAGTGGVYPQPFTHP